MGMIVQHNMNALNAYNALNANVSGLKKASEKLSSGYRINRAGDDAAGLAISEKMRSQLKGLNQAIRNSQDGINMVQTFEGAAQETHSILQRMKELAVESASGTYDNATDRAAIQLEFDQLNDELNQIADTDFNGTIVLNGGVMADGTVARNGEFNYADGYTETVQAALATDISGKQADTIADQSFYNKETADAVWDALGVDVADQKELNVTFMFDGERWVADTVTDKDGNIVDGARAAGLTAEHVERDAATGDGGFKVIAGKNPTTGKDIVATNAIFDELKSGKDGGPVQKGDTVTIKFTNTAEKTYAPKNIGLDEDFDTTGKDAFLIANTGVAANGDYQITENNFINKVEVTLNAGITDDAMNAALKTALKNLDDAKFTATYAAGKLTGIADDNSKITVTDNGDGTWKLTDDDSGLELATIKMPNIEDSTPKQPAKAASATVTAGATNGAWDVDVTKVAAKVADATTDEDITLNYNNGTGAWTLADGTAVADIADYGLTQKTAPTAGGTVTISYKAPVAEKPATTGIQATAAGTVKFGINVDAYNVADLSKIAVHGVATPKAATMASQVAEEGVTVANAFKNSTARMTYTDNITLQTGARTKDAVNFNFSYNTDGTADMGSLLANLDLSSRSTGLNTANLSLANADDANYAIDQIDKAINKTSMVRATFGSIQNRLEHKITNLTTTSENLTEAESSIRDTDMASEMMNYTKFNILQQAAQSMLAQANQQPQSILQLLG